MLVDEFLAPRTLIVSGKGGVGKTTVAASLAVVAARRGRRVCVVEVDRKGTLIRLLGGSSAGYEPVELFPGVWGISVSPEDALREYLDVQYHMKRLAKVFTTTHFVDYITTAAPGLKDILVLGKIWYLEQGRSGRGPRGFDTVIVDAPAAGHMLTFLSAPMGLSDALRVGPVRRQAEWLLEMLRDPARTRVHLVTLPEEMPVTETIETSEALEARLGIGSGAIFANGVYSELFEPGESGRLANGSEVSDALIAEGQRIGLQVDADDVSNLLGYARFLEARREIQGRHLTKLRQATAEPVLSLPFLFSAGLALPDVETLADVIEEGVAKL